MLALLVCQLLLGFAARAQSSTTNLLRLTEYQKDNWQVEKGLPSNNVRMIGQQRDGRLVLATRGGLCTFDGQAFAPAETPAAQLLGDEPANAVLLDHNDVLWVGTDGHGVLRQANGRVTNISRESGRASERIRMLFEDARGALWIATQNGAARYWNGQLQGFDAEGMIAGDLTVPFADDGQGGVLFLTSNGLFQWTNGLVRAVHLPGAAGSPTAVYRDSAGREWLGTTGGVLRLDARGNGWQVQDRLLPTASPVTTLLSDRLGSLWIGTRRSGLYRKSALGFEHYGVAEGLPDGGVKTLFLDDENDLWIGMLTGGLSRWREGAFAPYGEPEGFPAHYAAAAFADSRGALWLGTWDKGLFRLQNRHLQALTLPGNPAESPVRTIAEDRTGRVWVGTWFHGVYSYDGKRFTSHLLGTESPANAVSAIVCDRLGGLWVGTYEGVLYYRNGIPNGSPETLLRSQLVTAMVEDVDGSVLVGTLQGLFRISGSHVEAVHGLEGHHILTVFVDRLGTAWASSLERSLVQIVGRTAVEPPEIEGVRFPPAYSAVDDVHGNMWLGTARGLLRVSLVELHQLFAGQTKSPATLLLTREDGLRASDCSGMSQPSSTRMPDGTLWFTTTAGFVHSTPVAETVGTAEPKVYVRGWSLSDDASPQPLSHGSHAVLSPGAPDLLLYFWAKRLSNATQVDFRYRLAGYDHAWTSTHARVARYRMLPPGRYRFQVQGRIGGGPWSAEVATMLIVQQPHLYQTWYFRTALVVLVVSGIWLLLRLRLQHRVQRAKGSMGIVLEERNRIAQECHDTLMAGFAAISWQLEATANLFRDGDAATTPAAKSCELARSMVLLCQAEARRIIYDLRETEEVTTSLSKALRRMLEENHQSEQCALNFDLQGEELSMSPGSVHHLTRIGQEAVRNALRHARPETIQILLDFRASTLHMVIRDDGCGFQIDEAAQARSGHFGIAVMQERARKVGGTLRLHSNDEGTEVEATVPFDAITSVTGIRREREEVVQWIGL